MPKKTWTATRIENRHGGGLPDVYLTYRGLPVWVELKVISGKRVKLSPQQIAWHYQYSRNNGLSFFLAKDLGTRRIHLFSGGVGPDLAEQPIEKVQGSMFEGPAPLFEALGGLVWDHYHGLLALRPAP